MTLTFIVDRVEYDNKTVCNNCTKIETFYLAFQIIGDLLLDLFEFNVKYII